MIHCLTSVLTEDQIRDVFDASQRKQMCIGGIVNLEMRTLTLLSGALSWYQIPLMAFKTSGNGTTPNFTQFRIIDSGHTVQFGAYEAAVDAILADAECVEL